MDDPKKRQSVTDHEAPASDSSALSVQDVVKLISAMGAEQAKAFAEAMKPVLEKTGQANATAMRRSMLRSNENYNEVSPFTYPEGEAVRPKPRLTRKTFFGKLVFQNDQPRVVGMRVHDDALTPIEVQLFEAITETRTARGGSWMAEVRRSGGEPSLHVGVLMETQDQKHSLPSLVEILTELQSGAKVPSAAEMMQQIAEMQKQLNALQGSAA